MKIEIELKINEDGRKFLNYWDFKHGNDVCLEIIDGKIMLWRFDENANELPPREVSFNEFIDLVEKSV